MNDERGIVHRSSFIVPPFPSGLFSVALSVGLHRLDVIKHRALCSSDFPHRHPVIGAGAIVTAAAIAVILSYRDEDARNPRIRIDESGVNPAISDRPKHLDGQAIP